MKNIKKIGVFIVSLIILICVLCGMIATGGDKKESKAKSDRQTYTIADNSTASDNNTSKTADGEGTEVTTKDKTGASTTTESTTLKTDSGKTDKTTTETTTRATTRTTKESTTESTTRSTTRETTRETTTRTTRESTTESTTRATTRESTTEFTTRENTTESTTRATTETTTEKKTEQTTKATTESTTEKTTKTTTEAATESTTKHTHNWIWKTHTETVHHDAETHEEPIWDYDFTNDPNIEGVLWNGDIVWGYPVYTTAWIDGNGNVFFSEQECIDNKTTFSYSVDYTYLTNVIPAEKVIVGYNTVVDKEAWDETKEVKDYQYCSECGQKK